MRNKLEIIKELAEKCAASLNMRIISVDYVREFGINILRVIASKEPVMTIDDSEALNMKISDELDKVDLIDEEYYLEVSSEGIEKELRSDADIKQAIGEYICIRTKERINNKNEFYGYLLAFDEGELKIQVNTKGKNSEITLDKAQIEMIRLAVKF
jgi:ribosome maturation factor RimP